MQFKFRHSKITLNSKAKISGGFSVFFLFAENALEVYQDITKNDPKYLIEDLSSAGNIVHHNNVILVSLGKEEAFNLANLSKVAGILAKYLANHALKEINLHLTTVHAEKVGLDYPLMVEKFIVDLVNGLYYFDDFLSTKAKLALEKIHVISNSNLDQVLENACAILEGYFLVRDLANNPPNLATPSHLAEVANGFTKLHKQVASTILDEKAIRKLGMHAFLGVAKGSAEAAKFIQLEYKGAQKNAKPLVLVGKGITFDSGGISLKPGANMDDMKFDMCGAATVLGVFAAVVRLQLAVNLVVLVPTCENMPSGDAQKPGDIVTSMAGKTIEVLNTDAEGRLILCDALHYAKQFNPEWVIDVATLTGACIIALGNVASGLYVNDEKLYNALQAASLASSDKVWRMPLFEEYTALIKGTYADLLNIGGWGGKGGSVTAACFLKEFVDYKWAHLDIAGVANSSEAKGATGRPFKLLLELIRAHTQNLNAV